jgi:signal peptidase
MRDEISSLILHPSSFVMYTGPSMNPTLRQGDLLTVVPYEGRAVQRGDVIYFDPPGGERKVVHRVVRVTPQGVRTRGDNNSADDPYLLQASDIIGQVVAAQRGSRRRLIAGGWRGQFVMHWNRPRRLAFRLSARLLHGVYHGLAETGVFRRLLPPGLRPRLVTFEARHQKYLKLMMGGRVVGQYDTRQEQWHIQRPFRLFVDESTLPRPQMAPHKMTVPRSLFTPGDVISSAADRQCDASGTKSPITDQI